MLLAFLLTGSVLSALFISLIAGLVELHLVALLWYSGLELNFITLSLVASTYIFTLHWPILLTSGFDQATPSAFPAINNGEARSTKVREAFTRYGGAIFHGAISSLLVLIPLAASKGYIFKSFLGIVMGSLIVGFVHSFLFLPALMGLFGVVYRRS